MIDINTFLLMLMYTTGIVLIIALIVLVIKLINTVNRVNSIMDEVETKLNKIDKAFQLVDIVTDNMALISDKLVDAISNLIRKLFYKKELRKDDLENE